MLHNEPDPDAMASGLALRNVLRRTKATAIIGAIQGVTRPENVRMVNLLDIQVESIRPEALSEYDRIAMVDVQPHYFVGLIDRVDLVIDHHPEQPGYTAVFKDIRLDYGSTSTILTEHLRAVDANISERTATAMLYAIKSDTLFFSRQTNRVDLEAFSYLYPLADAAMIRKMEGAEITMERLDYVLKAHRGGALADQVFCAFLGPTPREDFITYVADFFLQLEAVKWTVVAGAASSPASAVPAATGRWRRRWCRWRISGRSSGISGPRTSACGCRRSFTSSCSTISPCLRRNANPRGSKARTPVRALDQGRQSGRSHPPAPLTAAACRG